VVDDSIDASHVHMLRNEGSVPLVTVTFQIVPAGATRRNDAPAPGNCPF
jgi:mannose-6-phosphate isomerase-like protein (cupin superfamily)